MPWEVLSDKWGKLLAGQIIRTQIIEYPPQQDYIYSLIRSWILTRMNEKYILSIDKILLLKARIRQSVIYFGLLNSFMFIDKADLTPKFLHKHPMSGRSG